MSIRRRPASQLAWVTEEFADRERRTTLLARYDDLLMEVEEWNEINGAGRTVPWDLLNKCLTGGAGPDDGAFTGAELIEYLLLAERDLMRPRLVPRNGLRAEYASRR